MGRAVQGTFGIVRVGWDASKGEKTDQIQPNVRTEKMEQTSRSRVFETKNVELMNCFEKKGSQLEFVKTELIEFSCYCDAFDRTGNNFVGVAHPTDWTHE